MKKIIYMHHRSSHHAKNSGYSRLIDLFPESKVIDAKPNFPYKLAKLVSRLHANKSGMYDSSSVYKSYNLYKEVKKYKDETIIHYLNAERDIRFQVKNNKLSYLNYLGTFHKPPQTLEKNITNIKYLKKLNGAICVGANQVDFIKQWLNLDRVVYIPHGIDTPFFKPLALRVFRQEKKLLFVGQHLRDFGMLNKVMSVILNDHSNISLDVVIRKDFADKVKPHKNISIHHGVNDEQLRMFYHEADLLFLPLIDATACNSILEAMSCGLPIVTSNVGGNFTYLENTNNVLCTPNNTDAFIEETLSFVNDENRLLQASEASRKKALEYDWKNIGTQVTQFYNSF